MQLPELPLQFSILHPICLHFSIFGHEFIPCSLSSFFCGTKSIPHLGHVPGLSDVTSGCIGQAYVTFALSVIVESLKTFNVFIAFAAFVLASGKINALIKAINDIAIIMAGSFLIFMILFLFI